MLYALVSLGNPGKKYAMTRHNAGRVVADAIDFSDLTELKYIVPDTYMNESGKFVKEYLKYHDDRDLIVIYDDKDLPFGKFRISHDRGDGGHNGLKSIIEALGTTEFIRLRIGIAHPTTDGKNIIPLSGDAVQKYVLGNLNDEEIKLLTDIIPKVKEAIETIVNDGYQKAMERYN